VREAHPTDGWRMDSNDKVGICVQQPRTQPERVAVAGQCCTALEMKMPLLVDTIDDRVGHAYSGMPDRLYVIDREGKVAYQGGRGPFGFKPGEMEQALVMLLLDEAARGKQTARVPLPSDAEAWRRLPAAEKGAGQPLPAWARALARSLPRTTAAMLELDHLQRAGSALEPLLRGKMRWAAARANGCAWTQAQALADLRRAGLGDAGAAALAGDWKALPSAERDALNFARKLTQAAYSVTDEEVAALVRAHGEKRVVAMVLLLAYANFQDRLVLTLGLSPDREPPLPPLAVRFRKGKDAPPPVPAARAKLADAGAPAVAERIRDAEWLALDFERLQQRMEGQRARAPRVPVPSWEEVRKHYPPGQGPVRPLRIKWSLVCTGYQPELALGWGACTRAFGQEAKQDRVFEESLFWVVTRSLQCFY
jgi:alkylhydroperoxidase family enzyme